MNRKFCGIVEIMMVMSGLAIGCQNNATVRVQRALLDGDRRLTHDSRLGRQLDQAARDLESYARDCQALERRLGEFPSSFTDANVMSAAQSIVEPWRSDVAGAAEWATSLATECRAFYNEPDIADRKSAIHEALARINDYFADMRPRIQNWSEQAKESDVLSKLVADPRSSVNTMLKGLQEEAGRGQSALSRIGFGGFQTTDVYVINPSDPNYQRILRTHGPWAKWMKDAFWQDLSAETLSMATAGVTGDSAIMFVMESPGQVRVYQLSMDPTQITRNIGLLVSKATGAVAKYMSAGIAP